MNSKLLNFKFLFITLVIFFSFFGWVKNSQAATTYYIDWIGGSDTNSGTSKSTPWKHAPGMQGCLITDTNNNNCRARTHFSTSGDTFVFKGGVTWPLSTLSFDWYFGNNTTFTVDQTWYVGNSWTRPIFDAENSMPTASPEGINAMMRVYGTGHIVDNIEFKRLRQNNDTGVPRMLKFGTSSDYNAEIKNCYFHGWSYGGTATADNMRLVEGDNLAEPDLDCKIHDNVWDGSESIDGNGHVMAAAIAGSCGHVYKNYFSYLRNAVVVSNLRYFWGNTSVHMTNSFDPGSHGNVMQATCQNAQAYYYNNYSNDIALGTNMTTCTDDGYPDYVFNNVMVGDYQQTIQMDNGGLSSPNGSTGVNVFNNTIQIPAGVSMHPITGPAGADHPVMPFIAVRNNHLIGDLPSPLKGNYVTTWTESNTAGQTNAQATSAGYISGSTYPYMSSMGTGVTVDAGTNLASLCSIMTDNGPSTPTIDCLKDASLGVDYNATTHTVAYPKRTTITRSTWDIGAYEYAGSVSIDTTPPGAPNGLMVQ